MDALRIITCPECGHSQERSNWRPTYRQQLDNIENKVNEIHAIMVAITQAFEAAQSNPMMKMLMPKGLNLGDNNGK